MLGFPGISDGKESACSVGDLDLIPGLGRSLELPVSPSLFLVNYKLFENGVMPCSSGHPWLLYQSLSR